MAENRSQEQYHDPDYSQFQPNQSQTTDNDQEKTANDKQDAQPKCTESRRDAICRIIEREFQRELASKEQEMHEINKTIEEAKELLRKVRYAVVYHYYHRKSVICTEEEIAAVHKAKQEEMFSYPPPGDKPQLAIHPSVKKLLGKRPYNIDDYLKGRPTRRAAQNATEQFRKRAKKPAETRIRMRSPIFDDEKDEHIECVSLTFLTSISVFTLKFVFKCWIFFSFRKNHVMWHQALQNKSLTKSIQHAEETVIDIY